MIYAPEGEAGPWPLIVFGHGSSRAGDHYEGTLSAWASAGYVVVAPDFPLSSEGTPGGSKLDEVESQTGDVSFLIDTALAELDTVDPERIGVGGQSLGAITTLGVGFNACCADPRIDVVTEFAGIWFPLSGGEQDPATTDRPLLMVHGGADHSLTSIEDALEAWEDTLDAPGGFITLTGAVHDDGYYDGPGRRPGHGGHRGDAGLLRRPPQGRPHRVGAGPAAVEDAGPEVATLQERYRARCRAHCAAMHVSEADRGALGLAEGGVEGGVALGGELVHGVADGVEPEAPQRRGHHLGGHDPELLLRLAPVRPPAEVDLGQAGGPVAGEGIEQQGDLDAVADGEGDASSSERRAAYSPARGWTSRASSGRKRLRSGRATSSVTRPPCSSTVPSAATMGRS